MSSASYDPGLASIFADLLRPVENTLSLLPVSTSGALGNKLAPAWTDLQFGATKPSLQAAEVDRIPSHGIGLGFQAALLRAPINRSTAWFSSTIALSWKGRTRYPGLGERLLTQDAASRHIVRGEAVAASVLANRFGGPVPEPSPSAGRVIAGGSVVVAGPNPRQDIATLGRLLQAQPATKLTVIVHRPGSHLARMAQRAGSTVLLRAETSIWTVVTAAATIHAPLHDEFAVIARLTGLPVFTDSKPAPACSPAVLAAAYLVLASRYLDPADGKPVTCEAFLDRMIDWRSLSRRVPSIACFAGISFWKRQRMTEFAGGTAKFARTADEAVAIATRTGAQGGIAVWPSRAPTGLAAAASAAGVPLYQVEDGFIRSRGLGADFIPPASVIIDRRGIYYDARQPSDLEALLAGHAFPPELLTRARRLMDTLVTRRVTKYNLGGARQKLGFPTGKRRILVPGQVANDLSVKAGGAGVAPGMPLLAEVRRRNPDAFIVYKPHPDVEAGHRPGAVADAEVRQLADLVVRDVEMGSLIEAVDQVHTTTSLTGFEALLRHRQVTTYGRPFYAGWGLTTDIHPPPRRGRQLSLEQLVAATLILYPHYLDPATRLPCSPEHLIDRLDQAADWRTGILVGLRRSQGAIRRVLARQMRRTLQ